MGSAPSGLVVIIPARIGSTRFPGKLLARAGGRTLIEWTWRRAARVEGLDRVWIATDSPEIETEATSFGASVVRTGACASGSDRVGAALDQIAPTPAAVINLQGDEPLVAAEALAAVRDGLRAGGEEIVTCASPLPTREAWLDPAVVKVIRNPAGRAVYFSRAPIPAAPDGSGPEAFVRAQATARVHVGIYGYPVPILRRLIALAPSPLERAESLEQLRALEAGIPIRVVDVPPGGRSVDTPEDWEVVRKILDEEAESGAAGREEGESR